MLLALDNDNHQHVGASSYQIANLPLSVMQVCHSYNHTKRFEYATLTLHAFYFFAKYYIFPRLQSESSEEACAVCLENPTVGDTMRHLPCLHKFHKDVVTFPSYVLRFLSIIIS